MPQNGSIVPPSVTADPDAGALQKALEEVRPRLAAMAEDDIVRMPGVDGANAVSIAQGRLVGILSLREKIGEHFGERGTRLVDELPGIVFATAQANNELAAAEDASDLSELHEQQAEDHALLLGDAVALANRRLIPSARVENGRPVQGYRTIVQSTFTLIAVLREHWATVEEKTAITKEEIDAIEKRTWRFQARLDEREQGQSRMPAAETRVRALSLLITIYGEVRRMITYVRWWNDDADSYAPSLWTRRGRKSAVSEEPVVDGPTPVVPSGPSPVNGGGPFTQ